MSGKDYDRNIQIVGAVVLTITIVLTVSAVIGLGYVLFTTEWGNQLLMVGLGMYFTVASLRSRFAKAEQKKREEEAKALPTANLNKTEDKKDVGPQRG